MQNLFEINNEVDLCKFNNPGWSEINTDQLQWDSMLNNAWKYWRIIKAIAIYLPHP